MPELPEVEITARLLHRALSGATIDSALAPGVKAMRTFDPPLSTLEGRTVEGVRRRGKHLIVDVSGELSLLIHLMSAGRLQLYDKRAGPRDRTSRLLVRVSPPSGRRVGGEPDANGDASSGPGEAELRLREFGTKQAAWVKLLRRDALDEDEALATLGPEAWPDVPALGELLDAPRPLQALLRDQHVIAGIGRSWADEILWDSRLSPFKRGCDLDPRELSRLRAAIAGCLGGAIEHYEHTLSLPIPDKLPMPLRIHHRQGQPCPRCGATLAAVYFEEHTVAYCPACQTEGRQLKDRRMSRLLK
jgi:formamidopyrimidine-DNA glycosylase